MGDMILLVDDDQTLLASMQRALHRQFKITTVADVHAGLEEVRRGEYAVVVSDYRMPGMNGVDFLAEVKTHSADSTRILLTGYADLKTAIAAVNESHIFRLLAKPIGRDAMTTALQAGINQHQLVIAERELLSKTLTGSIKILMDLLESVSPAAIQRATRLKMLVRGMVLQLQIDNAWQFELAAMLSQIGYITAPVDLRERYYRGQELSREEGAQIAMYAARGRDLLINVPRLEQVAEILGIQSWAFTGQSFSSEPQHRDIVTLGAQLLQTAIEYENRRARHQPHEQVIRSMRFAGSYDVRFLYALERLLAREGPGQGESI